MRRRASRRFLPIALVVLLVTSSAAAIAVRFPAAMLAKNSDHIVVATLTGYGTELRGGRKYEWGDLIVHEVIDGSLRAGDSVRLEWDNDARVECPRVEHEHTLGRPLIWLLKAASKGTVRADEAGRTIRLEKASLTLALLEIEKDPADGLEPEALRLAGYLRATAAALPEPSDPK